MKRNPNLLFFLLLSIMTIILISSDSSAALRYGSNTDFGNADVSFLGEEENDQSGAAVSIGGDVNGDGYDDLLIGAPGARAGKTYLFFGKETGFSRDINVSKSDVVFKGEFWTDSFTDYAGAQVCIAGDVNGDGFDDMFISAPNNFANGYSAGQVYLILGRKTWQHREMGLAWVNASFWGEKYGASVGSCAGAGDVNGDGFDDFLITGSYDEDGTWISKVFLIFGKSTGWESDTRLSKANASFDEDENNDLKACIIDGAGDVNGDGYDDIIVGAPFYSNSKSSIGKTYLIFGKPDGWSRGMNIDDADASFIGEDTRDQAGSSVAGIGDVNGDGYDDIIIGAVGNDESNDYAGQSYLIFGKSEGWSKDLNLSKADASFLGENPEDGSGISVAHAGDVNGDGYDDLLIGAYANDDGKNQAGKTYLILGKKENWVMDTPLSAADASFLGENTYDFSGWIIDGDGDVNGDGYSDIVIGVERSDEEVFGAGQTYLIFPEFNPKDEDNDGLSDSWEKHNFGSVEKYSGSDDPDDDGYTNDEEYKGNSDPTDDRSQPPVVDDDDDKPPLELTHTFILLIIVMIVLFAITGILAYNIKKKRKDRKKKK